MTANKNDHKWWIFRSGWTPRFLHFSPLPVVFLCYFLLPMSMTHYHIFPLVAFCLILNYKPHNIGETSGSIHKWDMNMDIGYWVIIDRWREGNEEHWNKESSLVTNIHMRPFCWNLLFTGKLFIHFVIFCWIMQWNTIMRLIKKCGFCGCFRPYRILKLFMQT